MVRSPADGYTLLISVLTNVFNTTLYNNLGFNFERDFVHVAGVANAPYVVVVPVSFPAATIPEFIAYAKANPGKINMASGGKGSSSHIFGELFKTMAGVDLVHVPYRTNSMPDLISGQVQMFVAPIPQVLELVRERQAQGAGRHHQGTPCGAAGPCPPSPNSCRAMRRSAGTGSRAPKSTPAEIVGKLNATMLPILADPKFKARLADLGVEPMPMTPAEFSKFIAGETDKWTKVIRAAGVVLE